MHDTKIVIIGFFILLSGYALQVSERITSSSCSSLCYNTGTVVQLIGTTLVIIGLVILAIGLLKSVRRRYFAPAKDPMKLIFDSPY